MSTVAAPLPPRRRRKRKRLARAGWNAVGVAVFVVMAFPDEQAFREWAESPDYQRISEDRHAGAAGGRGEACACAAGSAQGGGGPAEQHRSR